MKCEICGKEYVVSCRSCYKRVETWGEDGLLELMELSKRKDDFLSSEIIDFCDKYYKGLSSKRCTKAMTFRRALLDLGFSGKFIGRIHKNKTDYYSIRKREHGNALRYKLKENECKLCGKIDVDLFIHHIIPLSWGGVSTQENCITLCKDCHELAHKKLSKLLNREKLLEYLRPHKNEIYDLANLSIKK